jgi:hypothetical protein
MLSIVDPPAPAPGEFMLVFAIDSATYTKFYPHGGNATEPAYVVSSAGEATHVVLRSGAGTEIGRFKYAGIVGRGRRKLGTVTAADDGARRVDQWLDLPKPGGGEDQPAGLKINGKEYKWTDDIQHGDRGIYRVLSRCPRDVFVVLTPLYSLPAGTRLSRVLCPPATAHLRSVEATCLLTTLRPSFPTRNRGRRGHTSSSSTRSPTRRPPLSAMRRCSPFLP